MIELAPTPMETDFQAKLMETIYQPEPMDFIYQPQPDVECLDHYVPGGYHPTLIGDIFCNGRYEVVHKLGFGGYSTIWLARDRKTQRYVSLKILAARASEKSHEAEVLQHLMKGDSTHPGKRFIPPLLDQFMFDGPNGRHLCLVGEPAGCNIAESKEHSPDFMFTPDVSRSLAAQLVLGLSYLHANGICHGGMELSFNLTLLKYVLMETRPVFKELSLTHTGLP